MAKRKSFKKKRRNSAGHLSGFESQVANILEGQQVPYEYEPITIPYVLPSPPRKYKPDFVCGDMIIEAKGYFPYEAQQKMRAVQVANPHLDIRFVFMKPHAFLPRRKLTHAEWAIAEGFPWTDLEGLSQGIWRLPEGYLNAQ